MVMGKFYLKLASENLMEFSDCLFAFSPHVCSWRAVCSFLFLIWFKRNFILEQSDKQQLSSFFLFFGLALISFPFYCSFDDGQAFVELLLQLPSNWLSRTSLLLNRKTDPNALNVAIWKQQRIYIYFFRWTCCSRLKILYFSLSLNHIEFVRWSAPTDS